MKSKIKKLLEKIEIQTPCLNTTELEGLFYALVITPELIAPSEWIPIIFDDEVPECESKDVLQQLISELIHAYNYYNTLYLNGNLHFPTPSQKHWNQTWLMQCWTGILAFCKVLNYEWNFGTAGFLLKK